MRTSPRHLRCIFTQRLTLLLTSCVLIGMSATLEVAWSAPLAPGAEASPPALAAQEGAARQVIADYSVALQRPEAHWRLLSPNEARQLSGIAILGAVEPGRSFGLVLVEPARGMSLEDYAQTLLNNSPLDELLIEVAEALTYQGHESLKLVYSGDSDQGHRVRYLSYVLIRDGYAFQVSAGAKVGDISASALEAFSKAVTLLPEPVRGRQATPEPLPDAQGLTWQSRAGRFESLLGAFQLTPPASWSAQVGAAAKSLSPIATLSMSKRVARAGQPELDLSLLVSARACPDSPKRCAAWARAELIEAFELSPMQDGQIEWRLFERAAPFELFDRAGTPFSYALHTQVRGGEVLQLLAWTLKSQLPHGWSPLPEALKSFKELSAPRAAQLRATLSAIARGDQGASLRGDSLDKTSAWLGGRYEHEAYGVTWQRPSGLWSAQRREQGQALSVLAFEAPVFGLEGQLRLTRRGGGLIDAHTEALSALKRELGGALKVSQSGQGRLGGALSHWTELEEQGERPLRYRLHTSLSAGVAAYMITWAPAPRFPRLVIEQAEAQLKLGERPPPFALTSRCDPQGSCQSELKLASMRATLTGLPSGGDVLFYPNANVGERSLSVTYSVGEALIGAVVVGHTRPEALDPLAIAATQRLIPKLGGASLSPKQVWIHGREARLLAWSSAEGEVKLYFIKRPPLIYGYFVIAPKGHSLLKSSEVKLRLLD